MEDPGETPEELFTLGKDALSKRNFEESIAWFTAVVEHPEVDDLCKTLGHLSIGVSCFALQDFEAAERAYQKASEIGPELADIATQIIMKGLNKT